MPSPAHGHMPTTPHPPHAHVPRATAAAVTHMCSVTWPSDGWPAARGGMGTAAVACPRHMGAQRVAVGGVPLRGCRRTLARDQGKYQYHDTDKGKDNNSRGVADDEHRGKRPSRRGRSPLACFWAPGTIPAPARGIDPFQHPFEKRPKTGANPRPGGKIKQGPPLAQTCLTRPQTQRPATTNARYAETGSPAFQNFPPRGPFILPTSSCLRASTGDPELLGPCWRWLLGAFAP